jgi:hypothetical protein
MIGTTPSAFDAWWADFLNIAYPLLQMLFWVTIALCAVYAVRQLKRFVDARVGVELVAGQEISVEEFVE